MHYNFSSIFFLIFIRDFHSIDSVESWLVTNGVFELLSRLHKLVIYFLSVDLSNKQMNARQIETD